MLESDVLWHWFAGWNMATKESVSCLSNYTSHLQASRWAMWRTGWVGPCNLISSGFSTDIALADPQIITANGCDSLFTCQFLQIPLELGSWGRLQTSRICTVSVSVSLATTAYSRAVRWTCCCLLAPSSWPQEHWTLLMLFCWSVVSKQ